MEHPVQRELSERSIEFYKHLDFAKLDREDRGYDNTLMFLVGFGIILPPRVNHPEAMGLRHLALSVDAVRDKLDKLKTDAELMRERWKRFYLLQGSGWAADRIV